MRGIDGEMFGKESLLRIIREHASETAHEILSAIIEVVHSFRGDNDPEDDITLIVVKPVE